MSFNKNIKRITLKSLPITEHAAESKAIKVPFFKFGHFKSSYEILKCYQHNLKLLETILDNMVSEFMWDISYEQSIYDTQYQRNNTHPIYYDALEYSHHKNTHFLEAVAAQISEMAIVNTEWLEEDAGNGELVKITKFSEGEGYYTMACCDSSGCPIEDAECNYKYLVHPFGGKENTDKILKTLRADLDNIDHSKLFKDIMDFEFCKYSKFTKQLGELLFFRTISQLNLPSTMQKQIVGKFCREILINACGSFFQEQTYFNIKRSCSEIEYQIQQLKENGDEYASLSEPRQDEAPF